MEIEILADAERANFLLKYLELSVKISKYDSKHFVVTISSDKDNTNSIALQLFHAGISFGMQESRKSFESIYKPNKFKDDIMLLAND